MSDEPRETLKSPDSKWRDERFYVPEGAMSDSTFSGKPGISEGAARQFDQNFYDRPSGAVISELCMSDQEIRARALECAVHRIVNLPGANIWELVEKFEAYIRDGR